MSLFDFVMAQSRRMEKRGAQGGWPLSVSRGCQRGVSGRLSERYWAEQPGSGVEEEGVGAAGPL